jgi:hypothetical protein
MRFRISTLLVLVIIGLARAQPCHADAEFSLVIDPFTGATSLRNDTSTMVALDSYLVRSPGNPVLNPIGPGGWVSLNDAGFTGWQETFSASGDRLGEANLFGSLIFAGNAEQSIGNAYVPFSASSFGQVEPGLKTMNFTYTLANESTARIGDVEFIARNTLLLVIDPATGEASIENRSDFNISLDSYLIKSSQSVLDVGGWEPLADSNSDWFSSTGAANRIAEGNLFGSTFLAANGGSLDIGSPIDPLLLDDETDLELQFTVAGLSSSISGGVLFAASATAGPDADFDFDGDVDGDDLGIWQAGYGLPGSQGNGDADGNGQINGRDFLAWQRQYTGPLALAASAVTAVPEPSSLWLAGFGLVACGRRLRGKLR